MADAFAFFADARNLERLTPASLRFRVVTPAPITMRPGTRIDYRLRIYHLPLRWQSEITVWEPPHRFVDEQRRGPYRRWQHEHIFVEDEGGARLIDHVRYMPRGGRLLHAWLIRPDLRRIFDYRRRQILAWASGPSTAASPANSNAL